MNPAKRRRLDATASTLCKPFRSPLKVPSNNQVLRRHNDTTRTNNLEQQNPESSPSGATSPDIDPQTHIKESRSPSSLTTPISSIDRSSSDEVTVLQKRYSALTQELRKLKQDLDMAQQALKLCSSDQARQLERVTLKWRDIARSAADQVFELTNERVKEMGGIRAWQKSVRESSQVWSDHERGRVGVSRRRNEEAEVNDEPLDEVAHIERSRGSGEEGDLVEQTFTMSAMLHQMNINSALLGYDEGNEQWAD